MTEGVSRISISVPPSLLRRFDEALKRLGYDERSKAVQTAMQNFVTESKWICAKQGRGIGAIVLVYNPAVRQVSDALTELQHQYRGIATSVIQLRLDDENCLQIMPVQGATADVKALLEALMTIDGVKEVKLAVVTP
jgi:CopG family nickel-responsive transcriptional regulator